MNKCAHDYLEFRFKNIENSQSLTIFKNHHRHNNII